MSTETVFMFSGQGSQYFQMGKGLYENNQTFRAWMQRLDETVKRETRTSVLETLYSASNSKGDPFDRTLLTHPAIFMVEYSLAQALIHAGVVPDMVLGASLGSFAAAAVAGFLDVDEALNTVIGQAMVLDEYVAPGGMIAVLAEPALFAEEFLGGRSEMAAINFASNFVVSARAAQVADILAELKKRNIAHQRLPVSVPFHSRWVDGGKSRFEPFLRAIEYKAGRLPLVCCDQATALSELTAGYFWDIVRQPIRFREAVAHVDRQGGRRYIDVGPAGTLATFMKYGAPVNATSTVHAILSPFGGDQKNFAAVAASVH